MTSEPSERCTVFDLLDHAQGDCDSLDRLISEFEDYAQFVPSEVHAELRSYSSDLMRIKACAVGAFEALEARKRVEPCPGSWRGERLQHAMRREAETEEEAARPMMTSLKSKLCFVKALKAAGVHYVNDPLSLAGIKNSCQPNDSLCVLFFHYLAANEQDLDGAHTAVATRAHFLRFTREQSMRVRREAVSIAVDLDMDARLLVQEGLPPGTRICMYQNGKYLPFDFRGNLSQRLAFRTVLPRDEAKPDNRVVVELPCDIKDKRHACRRDVNWYCAVCGHPLEYDFRHSFHCDCGAAHVDDYRLDCGHPNHTHPEPLGPDSILKALQPLQEVNVLLVGEPHVGRSSWLNCIPFYLENDDLADAATKIKKGLSSSSFWLADHDGRVTEIKCPKAGGATPQRDRKAPEVHVVRWGQTLYRFIDVLVERTIDETAGSLRKTKRLLAERRISSLTSCCILLKSNERNVNLMLTWAIREMRTLVSPTNAIDMCIFLTHSRTTFFRPGDAMRLLQTMNDELELNIPLSRGNIFCSDSEPLRYVAAQQQGVLLPELKQAMDQTWAESVKAVSSFLEYLKDLPISHLIEKEKLRAQEIDEEADCDVSTISPSSRGFNSTPRSFVELQAVSTP